LRWIGRTTVYAGDFWSVTPAENRAMSQPVEKTQAFGAATAKGAHGILARFESAWNEALKGGPEPLIDSFVAELPERDRPALRGELLKVEQQYRHQWRLLQRSGSDATGDFLPAAMTNTPEPAPGATAEFSAVSPAGPAATIGVEPGGDQDGSLGIEGIEDANDNTRMVPAEQQTPARSDQPVVAGYLILGELGRGGMGVVYKARQIKLHRIVALKMVLAGAHAGTEQLARFYTEAQAVAHLQHPNIVQIYEVSEQVGLPYFSLEFVDGGSLAQEAAGKPQPVDKAARMVKTLAGAMHHAHQHNVVHRDLKPANVLLTADGVPKITDFGLAKRLEDESSSQTRSGAILGTPSYMAPEQAMGEVHRIGPLTDVYSLGAILYELLTGRPPFAGPTPMDTVVQVTRDEPVAPSQLQPNIPRDLETICLKCLQKEQPKRYASAAALADDLGRFLNGEPILARPVSVPERLWRWCRRNPKIAASIAVVAFSLVTVTVVSISAAVTVTHERDQKEEQRKAAEVAKTAAQIAEQAAKISAEDAKQQALLAVGAFYDVVTKIDAKVRAQPGEGMQQLRLDVLDDTRAGMDRVLDTAKGSAMFNRTVAALDQHAGDVFKEIGRSEDAQAHYEKCREVIEAMAAEDPNNDANIYNLAVVYERLGDVSLELENLGVAREYHRKSLEQRIRLSQMPIADPGLTPEKVKDSLTRAYSVQSSLALMLGDPAAAWKFMQKYLEVKEGESYATPRDFLAAIDAAAEGKQYIVADLLRAGELGFRLHDVETCQAFYEKALKRSQAAMARNAKTPAAQRALATSCGAIGDLHLQLRDGGAAVENYSQAHELMLAFAAGNPDNVAAQRNLSFSYYRLATANRLNGNVAKAQEQYEECLKLRKELAQADASNVHKQIDLMVALARTGQHADAADVAAKLDTRASEDPSVLFQIACGYSLCVPAVVDGKTPEELTPQQRGWRDQYSTQALDAVQAAIATGYKDAVALEHDPDLSPVRDDPRYAKLLKSIK
jgi:serine/threonine-protein kinase